MSFVINLHEQNPLSNSPILIGYRKEDDTRRIQYNLSSVIDNLGPGSFYFIMWRGDRLPYIIPPSQTSLEGNMAVWLLNEIDMAIPGAASCQLVYEPNDSTGTVQDKWKSPIYQLYIGDSLDGTPGISSGWITWYDQFREIADIVERASAYPPYIGENGHWFIYDPEQEQYVDTQIAAHGGDAILYTPQTLSSSQKQQARQNLDILFLTVSEVDTIWNSY